MKYLFFILLFTSCIEHPKKHQGMEVMPRAYVKDSDVCCITAPWDNSDSNLNAIWAREAATRDSIHGCPIGKHWHERLDDDYCILPGKCWTDSAYRLAFIVWEEKCGGRNNEIPKGSVEIGLASGFSGDSTFNYYYDSTAWNTSLQQIYDSILANRHAIDTIKMYSTDHPAPTYLKFRHK